VPEKKEEATTRFNKGREWKKKNGHLGKIDQREKKIDAKSCADWGNKIVVGKKEEVGQLLSFRKKQWCLFLQEENSTQ